MGDMMTEFRPTDLLGEIYYQWAGEMSQNPDMSLGLLRIMFDDWQRATTEPERVTYRHAIFGGVPGLLAEPIDNNDPRCVLLFMHGGGFALGSPASHRKLAGHFARALGASAFVADFRLAPEHPFPRPVDDGVAAFAGLVASGYNPADITPVGDSAGGNLAIALVLRRMAAKEPLPRQVITISPWLNMENNGATLESNEATDFLIAPAGLQANIDRYLGDGAGSVTDPFANPLYADLTGFPRLYICAGSIEALFDDSVRLHAQAKAADVDVTFTVGERMQHCFLFMAGNHPRADQEIETIAKWYRAGRAAL